MFELRYYRGSNDVALLPLVGTRWLIGSTELADLNLPNEVCGDQSFVLELVSGDLTAGRSPENVMLWRLTRVPAATEENTQPKSPEKIMDDSICVRLDEMFSISGLSFVVSTHDTPWTLEELSISHQFGKNAEKENNIKALGQKKTGRRRPLRLATFCVAFLALSAGVYHAVSNNYFNFTSQKTHSTDFATLQKEAAIQQQNTTIAQPTRNRIETIDQANPSQTPTNASISQVTTQFVQPIANPKPELTAKHAKTLFREMMDKREIGSGLVIKVVGSERIEVSGRLSETEEPILMRTIDRFEGRYKGAVSVVANWNVGAKGLPFEIVQIVSGPMAHIITKDGKRLFVGDELENMRLVSISNDKVVFEGQENIEVSW
ncbi:hypothetical protein [Veronia pacifica]|uniref:Yop protein translocation protein D periplasmic domain-containing protein n=1 Tax=Veronia pacifica TaxID=1080227 RepID=A0A1C3ER19_9GAMM|nr:hypothetical protein [Veronia pacifica]ODA35666.1 hypothetical protein A8L45_03365 [Veronia pacifica]